MIKIISLWFLLLVASAASNGDSCRVLLPALQGSYLGACKKGLANGLGEARGIDYYKGYFRKGLPHGQGTYRWAGGEEYTGQWQKGKRNGYGVYRFKFNGKDTLVSGRWVNDVFAGPVKKKPEVSNMRNVNKYQIRNIGAYQNRVLFDFRQNGSRNTGVENLSMIANSGSLTTSGQLKGFDNLSFPVTIMLRYSTPNKMHTITVEASFQISIFEPGDYEIILFN